MEQRGRPPAADGARRAMRSFGKELCRLAREGGDSCLMGLPLLPGEPPVGASAAGGRCPSLQTGSDSTGPTLQGWERATCRRLSLGGRAHGWPGMKGRCEGNETTCQASSTATGLPEQWLMCCSDASAGAQKGPFASSGTATLRGGTLKQVR